MMCFEQSENINRMAVCASANGRSIPRDFIAGGGRLHHLPTNIVVQIELPEWQIGQVAAARSLVKSCQPLSAMLHCRRWGELRSQEHHWDESTRGG